MRRSLVGGWEGSASPTLDSVSAYRVSAYRGTVSTLHLSIDPESVTAPFEQVRTQIAAAVADGRLDAGTRLPTVRQLAADLGLAANTVARAYRELEADSVIATHGRGGTFVRSDVVDEPTAHSSAADAGRVAATDYVHSVRRLGPQRTGGTASGRKRVEQGLAQPKVQQLTATR